MNKPNTPELKKFLEKQVSVKLNAERYVTGILRGFDPFMNLVIDDATEDLKDSKNKIGIVVIRGTSIINLECKK